MAKVILIGFLGIKESAVLHVLQRWTNGIRKLGFFAGVCMITSHCIMHVPFIVTLTDHLVPPLAKFLVQEVSIFVPLNFPFLLKILAVQVRQLKRLRGVGVASWCLLHMCGCFGQSFVIGLQRAGAAFSI